MNKTLVIMAAGMGSRFGGLKQIEPVGPSKEIIADYSVYDAKESGFSKIIFIIRKENEDYFKKHIINKYKDIDIILAYQELDIIFQNNKIPKERKKMLGTAHALYCAKDYIDGDFVIINSDDFYGKDSFMIASKFLDDNNNDYLTVNFPFIVTASKFGNVKRGVVIEDNNEVKSIIESQIDIINDKIIATPLQGDKSFEIDANTPVAVNFFVFRKDFLNILEKELELFVKYEVNLTNEFLIPELLKKCLDEKLITLKSRVSNGNWIGMTYKEDLDTVKKHINSLIERGEYPNKLW